MKKRISCTLILILLLMLLFPATASADMGPKPSVRITFTGAEGLTWYGTLLSFYDSTGPSSAWDGREENAYTGEEDDGREIWEAFVAYEDTDGYYFLQEWWDCTETHSLNWTYYPPSPFKVLLYFPESGEYRVSPIYERYAFDSYFAIDLAGVTSGGLVLEKSYNFGWETVSLLARILFTILAELCIALLFGYREKGLLRLLAIVNLCTQILLNVLLNIINYTGGSLLFVFCFVLFELVVFAIEAILYGILIPRRSTKPTGKGKAVLYAFVANAASFALGLAIAHWIPGIF